MKRKILLWTTVFFLTWMLVSPCSFVFAEDEKQIDTNLYHYVYRGDQYEISDHSFTFQWWYKDLSMEQIRNRHHAANIFKLTNLTNPEDAPAVYCSDFLYSIATEGKYKRLNLEDSTYYNEAAARHIRSIMENGYWYDWTTEDLKQAEENANMWIETYDSSSFETSAFLPYDAEEEVSKISNLTAGEALMATQLAIWAFANTEGDDWWVKYYESMPTDVEGKYQAQEMPDNVKAFRKYLIHQQSQPLVPEDILFSDQYFITDSVIFTGSPADAAVYDLQIRAKLAAPIDSRDKLNITANLSNGKSESFSLSGEDGLQPDADGYYTLPLNNLTKADAASVSLSISGEQYVEGIYFYEAKSEDGTPRETSQNLVGKAAGMTPVSASVDLAYEVGTKCVSLYKTDVADGQPLAGAVFDLYGEKEGESYLVFANLVTDENGQITMSNLPEDFAYYFVETKAPEGYAFEEGTQYHVHAEGTVTVSNQKLTPNLEPKPEPEQEPAEPEEPEEPIKPEEPVSPEIPITTEPMPEEPAEPPISDTPTDLGESAKSEKPKDSTNLTTSISSVDESDSQAFETKLVATTPKTGDATSLTTFLLLFIVASAGILCRIIYKKR